MRIDDPRLVPSIVGIVIAAALVCVALAVFFPPQRKAPPVVILDCVVTGVEDNHGVPLTCIERRAE